MYSRESVGADMGKPIAIAPRTTRAGVATTGFTRNVGDVIRRNFRWTAPILGYLIVCGLFCTLVAPGAMRL